MNKSLNQFCLLVAGSFVCLYLAFSATVNVPYINHDSIRYFHKFYNHANQANPMYGYLKSDGRLVGAELEQVLYKSVDHLSDISRLRLITIFVIALSAALLIMAAQAAGMEAVPAFCLGTAIFTLPGIQDIVFVPYLALALAVFLSLLANGRHFIFTLLLLETIFFIYPPATFFFLLPAAFMVIFQQDWKVVRRLLIRDVLLWALSAAIFYFILRVFLYAQLKSNSHEIAFSLQQILLNIAAFPLHGLPQVFNLWNVYYSQILGLSLAAIVAVGIAVNILNKKICRGRLLALAGLFLIFNLIWFLFGGYMPRQFGAAQALALVLIYYCGQRLGRWWPVLLLCFALVVSNQMMTSNVLNNYSALMFIRGRLVQSVNSSTREIHFIDPKDKAKGYNNLPMVYDNINGTVSDFEIPDFVRVALKDMGEPFELHCIVTYSDYGEKYSLSPNGVVIDMNELVYENTWRKI